MVLRNSSCREQGNLLATAKWALPRHTASHDLLKKHNGASSPNSSFFISHLSPPPSICQFLISILWPPFSLLHFPFFWPTLPVVLSAIQQIHPPPHTALELLHSQLVSIDFNVRALFSLLSSRYIKFHLSCQFTYNVTPSASAGDRTSDGPTCHNNHLPSVMWWSFSTFGCSWTSHLQYSLF